MAFYFRSFLYYLFLKRELHQKTQSELFYLRTSNGVEIDLIIDRKSSKELIEIKKTSTSSTKMFSAIKDFIKQGDKGYLIYNGNYFQYADNIAAVNYKTYLKE